MASSRGEPDLVLCSTQLLGVNIPRRLNPAVAGDKFACLLSSLDYVKVSWMGADSWVFLPTNPLPTRC